MTIRYDEKSLEGPDYSQYHIQINDQCCSECQCQGRQTRSSHGSHSSRLRVLLFPALLTLLGLLAFLALSCAYSAGDLFGTLGTGIAGDLARRATGDTTTNNGPFIDRKLYLIIIFVGIVVVIILGIMLSAWCCRGAFENPLCCPCYLCACCGGLACLECIGCGLCAEGLDQV